MRSRDKHMCRGFRLFGICSGRLLPALFGLWLASAYSTSHAANLGDIFSNLDTADLQAAKTVAAGQAVANASPRYNSVKVEQVTFEGYFTPANANSKLAVFSDDGCDVYVNGTRIHNRLSQGQHLPDLNQSFHVLTQTWTAGTRYEIKVVYSNTIYQGVTDIDGATLFAFAGGGAVEDLSVEITMIDAQFAPSVERLNLKYTIKPDGVTATAAKLEVFKKGDTTTPIYSDNTIPKTGADVVYKQGATEGWNGKTAADKWISPVDSDFTVKITVSKNADFSDPKIDSKPTKVLIESLAFNLAAAKKVIMNDLATQEEIVVTVKLKKKDGTGAVTEVPLDVNFSFSDPGAANTAKADSYEYEAGKFLGKKDDAAAIHWADHADADSESSDMYKLVCKATLITAAGANQGKTKVYFKPSGVGGDDFKLKGVVKHTDGTDLKAEESAVLTVWRQVKFDKIYEMDGETHVSTNAAEAKIQPYFDPPFVDYDAGAVNAIPAAKSVKYIGLWKNAAPYQLDWATISAKKAGVAYTLKYGPHKDAVVATEIPTATELADANGAAGAARDAARIAITQKAQAWVERIDTAFLASLGEWKANGGIANNSLVGIKYYHPKYSSGGGDSATAEWDAWVTVTTYFGNYAGRDPDGIWPVGGGDFGGLSQGDGVITIPKGLAAAGVENSVAHEAGHATKSAFKREDFGATLDHSAAAGLMDVNGTQNAFTAREQKVLRGIKP